MKNINVMWVGLSAKKAIGSDSFRPLQKNTTTGALVAEIEAQCVGVHFYKTNLVKFAPLDKKGKLRYPTIKECAKCYPDLEVEIQSNNPQIVFLLGIKASAFVLSKLGREMPKLSFKYEMFEHEGRWYVPIHHPSYIMVYKRKEKDLYIKAVKAIIRKLT